MPERHSSTLSDAALRALVARSAPLWPRIHERELAVETETAGRRRDARTVTEVEGLIGVWRSVLKCDTAGLLERRLALEGVTLEQTMAALARGGREPSGALPRWAMLIQRVLSACELEDAHRSPPTAVASSAGTAEAAQSEPRLPFREVFSAFTRCALAVLREGYPHFDATFAPEAVACLELGLAQELSELCAFALEFEFSRARRASAEPPRPGECRQYRAFVEHLLTGGLASFFREYPVLSRLVGTLLERWVDAISEFAVRLEADRRAIAVAFHGGDPLGRVRHLSPNLSDPHEQGRRVILLQFEAGLGLAYKPRSIALDGAFYDLLRWVNRVSGLLELHAPRVLERATYGWVERIVPRDCSSESELGRFYRRAGMLLALVSVLQGTDFHHGNILASGEHPVLIDLESLLAGRLSAAVAGELDRENVALLDVVRTGLLPNYQQGPRARLFDVSGLGGQAGQYTGFSVPDWRAINSDLMSLAQREGTTSAHDNRPRLNGQSARLTEHRADVIDGFRSMGGVIIAHAEELLALGGPLGLFAGLPARFVFRPTSLYHLMLRGTLAPEFLRAGESRSIQLEALARFLLRREGHERLWELLRAELRALEEGEVPYFSTLTDGTHVAALGAILAPDALQAGSHTSVRTRIAELDEARLEDQVQAVNWALSQHALDRLPELPARALADCRAVTSPSELRAHRRDHEALLGEAARALGQQLAERALRCTAGPLWFGPEFNEESNRQSVRPTGHDLHGGTPGIAVFLAALASLQGGPFGDLSLRSLEVSRRSFRERAAAGTIGAALGGAIGDASLLYSWLVVGTLLHEPALVDAAVSGAQRLEPGAFPADAPTDVVRGIAGTLSCLLALYEKSGDTRVLGRAKECGRLLLARRESTALGERAWRSRHGVFLTGFAHGSSGIAFALLRLYGVTRDAALLEASVEAIAFESRGFDAEARAWPDLRHPETGSERVFGNAWCHGSPGIGLLRLEALRHEHSAAWLLDVESALARAGGEASPLDQLCCGNAGRAELLLRAERQLERPELGEVARALSLASLERAARRGQFCLGKNGGLWNPGLFLGTSGIGYQLLRLASPRRLPSLLTWEAPT